LDVLTLLRYRLENLHRSHCPQTYISRGERFCDGHMAEFFENGVAQAATRRLVNLAQTQEAPEP